MHQELELPEELREMIASAKPAPFRGAGYSQEQKNFWLARRILTTWFKRPTEALSVSTLESEAVKAGYSSRVKINLGIGLGGKGGIGLSMNRIKDEGVWDWRVNKTRENAALLLKTLGQALDHWWAEVSNSAPLQDLFEWASKWPTEPPSK